MEKEQVQSIAFNLIAYAGSSFDHFYKAIECARNKEWEESDAEMELGHAELKKAHASQTDLLSAEINSEEIPFSILMTHAQDHLTMAILTEHMAKELIYLHKERGTEKHE